MESIFEYVRETSDLGDVIRCKTVDGFEVNLAKSELTDVERKCLTDGCFTGDTLVMTKAGLKRIDSIQDGELVLSKDTKTGQVDYKSVLYVYRKSTTNFINLTVAGKLIETTPTHLFMLEDGNWRSAENLKAGDRIVTANGEIKTVDSVEEKHYNEARRIFNLNVDKFHTYFVGSDKLLVHNDCSEEISSVVNGTLKFTNNSWQSTAGLIYELGSREGNRVLHVLEHIKVNPNKPLHTVFNVGKDKVLGIIDEAWSMRAKVTPVLQNNGNQVFDIPMGKVIGTDGETTIRIVVENGTSKIVTSFPVK